MEALSRRIALVHHKVLHWDHAITKAFSEDPAKLRPQRATEHRISQHVNQHFFHQTSGAKEVTGKTMRLTKKQNEEALSEMLKLVAKFGVSGATNQELEKERVDVSRACLLLLQLETWLDIAGGNDFLSVPAQHVGAVQTTSELLEESFRVVKLRFPTAIDSYDVLQKIESDIDMMIDTLAWTCAIDRRLLAVDAGYTRLIDICCSVRVRKAVTSEREAFLASFDQAVQHLRHAVARLLTAYTTFLAHNSPTYAIISSRFEAVTHATRSTPLTIRVRHSLTQDSVYLAMKLIFQQFQSQVPESLTLLVNPLIPDELLGMAKSARDQSQKGTIQHARDVKVAAAWKSIQNQENRAWAKRSRRSGAAGRYASILILQKAWRNYLACRDAVRLCAQLAMLRTQKQSVSLIISWWRRRRQFLEKRSLRMYEAALRRNQLRQQLADYRFYCQKNNIHPVFINNNSRQNKITSASTTTIMSSVVHEYEEEQGRQNDLVSNASIVVQDEDGNILMDSRGELPQFDHHQNNNNNNNQVNVTVSSIHDDDNDDNQQQHHNNHDISLIENEQEQEEDNSQTPWRSIPVRWKSTQRKNYEAACENVNFFNTNNNNNISSPSSTMKQQQNQQQQPYSGSSFNPLGFDTLNISTLSSAPSGSYYYSNQQHQAASVFSPSREQRDSIVFCAARRIQNFMIYVKFIKNRDRMREQQEKKLLEQEKQQQQHQQDEQEMMNTETYASSRYTLPLAPGGTATENMNINHAAAAGSALDHLRKNRRRPSSSSSSVLEKFRRIRRQQQQLSSMAGQKWKSSIEDENEDQEGEGEDYQREIGTGLVSADAFSRNRNRRTTTSIREDSPAPSTCLSTVDDDEDQRNPIERSLSRSTYFYDGDEQQRPEDQDQATSKQQLHTRQFASATESLTYASLKKLSESLHDQKENHKNEDEKEKENENQDDDENKKKQTETHHHHHHDPSASEHLKQNLDQIPLVFKVAKKGDGNVLVRPDGLLNEGNVLENNDDGESDLVFNEEEFKKQLMAQTGKTEIDPEELQRQKNIAEKYIQDVSKLENHRSDEIVLGAMRGETSKLLLASVATMLVRKESLMFEMNNLKTQSQGYVAIEDRAKWQMEELRDVVSRLRRDEETKKRRRNRKGKVSSNTPHAEQQQESDHGEDENQDHETSLLGKEVGRVLSSDDDTTPVKNSSAQTPAKLQPISNNNINKPTTRMSSRSNQLLSPLNKKNTTEHDDDEQTLLVERQTSSQQQQFKDDTENIQNQFSISSLFVPADKQQKLLNAAFAPLLQFKLPQHDLRHPYQNWSNATQILRSVVKRGLEELVKRVKKEDLREMFQFSDEELYRREVRTVVRKQLVVTSSKRNTDDDGETRSEDEEETEEERYEDVEVEEERLVLDEMALYRQKQQAIESTLQLFCETAGANSLQNAIYMLSSDISKLVADENRPIVSILRTMLGLESRRLIVPWIIIVGAGKEFGSLLDPDVISRQEKRVQRENAIQQQKQRRSRRKMERQMKKQQLLNEFKLQQQERKNELAKRIERQEMDKKIKAFAKQQRREGRLERKKQAAELKKVRAAARAAKKEKKKQQQQELEKQQQAEKENKKSTTKPSGKNSRPSSSSPNRPTKQKQNTSSPALSSTMSSISSSDSISSISSSLSSSSGGIASSSASSSSSTASSTTREIQREQKEIEEWDLKVKELQTSIIRGDDEDEEENGQNDGDTCSSTTISSFHSSDYDDLDENDEEGVENNEIGGNDEDEQELLFQEEEQAEFDDQALVIISQGQQQQQQQQQLSIENDDHHSYSPLCYDDIERIRHHHFLKVAASNCNLQDLYDFVMKSDHSLVRRWLNVPLHISRSKAKLKRRVDLLLMGSLMLPFLKTLQQWFESNFVFSEEQQQEQQEQDQERDQLLMNDVDQDQVQHHHHYFAQLAAGASQSDDDDEATNNYLQNETFDEEYYSGNDDDDDDDDGSLPPSMLMGGAGGGGSTGRGGGGGENESIPHNRPETGFGFADGNEEDDDEDEVNRE